MSPVVKRKREKFALPGKYLLFVLTVLCCIMMLLTFGTDLFNRPLNAVAGYVVVPFQKGISSAGGWLSRRSEELVQIRQLLEENERLKAQVAELTEQNTILQQERYELANLRSLLELDDQYSEYSKVGARIISRNSSNWYSDFTIDKGYRDGLSVDMNVIAGGGLVGRITAVGPNWAKVTSIISDNSNVSGSVLATGDKLIVSGDLQTMADGVIRFSQLINSDGKVAQGDKIVTSNISDKYLPNILVGYIHTMNADANNLTSSGYITPAVDFEHLEEVLVITILKQQINEEEALVTE